MPSTLAKTPDSDKPGETEISPLAWPSRLQKSCLVDLARLEKEILSARLELHDPNQLVNLD